MKKNLFRVLVYAVISALPLVDAVAQKSFSDSGRQRSIIDITGVETKSRSDKMVDVPRLKPFGTFKSSFSTVKNLTVPVIPKERTAVRQEVSSKKGTVLMGSIVSSSAEGYKSGMYSISTTEPVTELVRKDVDATGGGTYVDGQYYCQQYLNLGEFFGEFWVNQIWNTETWELIDGFTGDITSQAFDLAYDHVTDKIYGCCLDAYATGEVVCFGTISKDDYSFNWICDSYEAYVGLAVNAEGTLYALTKEGLLYTLDKSTGAKTYIGNTGLVSVYNSSATIDRSTGVMYYVLCTDNESALYTIDTSTAVATKVYDFQHGEEIMGLYVFEPLAEDEAPAAVKDLSMNFNEGDLTGTVTFTAPVNNYYGDVIMGDLSYTLTVNNETYTTGTVAAGSQVSVDVTVPAPGNYEFRVWMTNEAGNGPRSKVNGYVGYDVPGFVHDVELKSENGKMTLTWSPVSYSMNNGYFDPSLISYKIVRYPDAVVVAENHKDTRFTETLEIPASRTNYYYEVAAVNGTQIGGVTKSNPVGLGFYTVPYDGVFESQDDFNEFTTINANNDTRQWEYYNPNHAARISYHNKNSMDDWLITPGIVLEAGKVYEFSFSTYAHNTSDIERIEAYIGDAPTVEAMTRQIVIPTEVGVVRANALTLKAMITVSSTGNYYFGMHGCSDPFTYYLYVDHVSVVESAPSGAPAAIDDLHVTAGERGALEATVNFTAPTLNVMGDELDVINEIDLKRDGELIHTFVAPMPGEKLTFKDTDVTNGTHTYAVVARNSAGSGQESSATLFVGVSKPLAPAVATITETEVPGEVTVSWSPVTADVNGTELDNSNVTYVIVDEEGIIASDIQGNSYTFMAVAKGQEFVYYGVAAVTAAGISDVTVTDMIPVGEAYKLPFNESFANGTLSSEWATNTTSYASWLMLGDGSGINSVDGDNGLIALSSQMTQEVGVIYSGKIDISAAKNPVLIFYTYGFSDDENVVMVQIDGGEGFNTVKTLEGIPEGWNKIIIPLDEYKDNKNVRIAFMGGIVNRQYILFDNISVIDRLDYDLAIASVSVPRHFRTGEEDVISVTVVNNGAKQADTYSVSLYRDGEKVSETACGSLAADEKALVEFKETLTVTAAAHPVYSAVIEYAADQNVADNKSDDIESTVIYPVYPVVGDLLAAENTASEADLSWSAPVIEHVAPVAVTDDFESYDSFSINYAGDWSFIDADGNSTYTIEGMPFPGEGSRMAYIVFDCNVLVGNHSFSGSKVMGCMASPGKNDDWLISPLLSGDAQTISFQARSISTSYGNEKFEVYYSMTGKAVGDFMLIRSTVEVPDNWTKYNVELPAGTKYFAIRCVSEDCFMFMVDDVTYIPAPLFPTDLELKGYNVYRDLKPLDAAGVTSYKDSDADEGTHVYHVTAVYNYGESALSNAVEVEIVENGGVSSVSDSGITISVNGNTIVVRNASGKSIRVYGADGRLVNIAVGEEETAIKILSGSYIVTAGDKVAKVIVR